MDGVIINWVDVCFEMDGVIIIWVDGVIMHWTMSKAPQQLSTSFQLVLQKLKNKILVVNDKPDLTLNINGSDLIFIFYDVTIK